MKHFFTSTAVILLLMTACRKETSPTDQKDAAAPAVPAAEDCQAVDCLPASQIGYLHNQAIAYVDANMNPSQPDDLSSVTENEIQTLNQYFETNPICEYEEGIVSTSVTNSNSFYESVKERLGYFSASEAALMYIDSVRTHILPDLLKHSIISEREHEFINILLDRMAELERSGAQSSYGDLAAEMSEKWRAYNFDECSNEGFLSNAMLQVMSNSYKYWVAYASSDAVTSERLAALPLWVGLDAVGAIAGGGAAALDSYWNTGKVNWKSTAAWALGGAVAGSVPATRWFKRLFN